MELISHVVEATIVEHDRFEDRPRFDSARVVQINCGSQLVFVALRPLGADHVLALLEQKELPLHVVDSQVEVDE